MRRIVSLASVVAVVVCISRGAACGAEESPEPVKLSETEFAESLDFFLVDPEAKMDDVWSVRDDVLICKGEPMGYLCSKKAYTNFKLSLEWRWPAGKEPGNSGVLMRITGKPMMLPKCVEAQLKSGDAGDFWSFNGFHIEGDPARARKVKSPTLGELTGITKAKAAENEPGQWNKYEITADGRTITLAINGQQVNKATNCDVVAGRIGLQSEGGEIHFRNLKLTPLEGKQVALFNGEDLAGWSFRAPDPNAKMEDTFSVHDGVLCCTGKPVGYLKTDMKYTNYILRLQWRWPEGSKPGNNGVLVRVLEGEHFFGNVWPKCVEAQLANRRAGDIFTIGQYPLKGDPERTKGRYTAMEKPSNEKPQGQWNDYEVVLVGGNLTLVVNGEVQNVATEVAELPGAIGLQSEGAPIEYRNIVLVPMDE